MKTMAVAFAGFMIAISTAGAFQIAPECKRMPDQIGCTCAVQNGGGIIPQRGGVEVLVFQTLGNQPDQRSVRQRQKRARGLR